MGEGAVGTHLYPALTPVKIAAISGTVFKIIQGTVAKQTVKSPLSFMTGKVLAICIFKKFMTILHFFLHTAVIFERLPLVMKKTAVHVSDVILKLWGLTSTIPEYRQIFQ